MAVVSYRNDDIRSVSLIDHYRLDKELLLLVCFSAFLVLFCRAHRGTRLLSFILAVLTSGKCLSPAI